MVAELVVIGGGKMGEALVSGTLASGWAPPSAILVVEASSERRSALIGADGLASRFPGLTVQDELPDQAPAVVLAVKPADLEGVCRALEGRGTRRLLSIAAGVTLERLEAWAPAGCAVIRAMPNMASVVQAGATALAAGTEVTPDDLAWASAIMGSVGLVVEVAESLLDAVTGVSGSGPAYVMLVAEAMTEAGVLVGLPRDIAASLVVQTLVGSAKLLTGTGQSPEQLRAAVTSPGGTTAAALRQLEARGVRSAFIEAVAACAERSKQLGQPKH